MQRLWWDMVSSDTRFSGVEGKNLLGLGKEDRFSAPARQVGQEVTLECLLISGTKVWGSLALVGWLCQP